MEQIKFQPILLAKKIKWLVIAIIGLFIVVWGMYMPEGLLGKADAIGYAVCHRIDLRSFHLGDRPLPLCARCSGMYLGALVGILFQFIVGKRGTGFPKLPVAIALLIFAAAFVVDGGNSFIALLLNRGLIYSPTNTLRLFTGTGMGLVIASALVPAFNQSVWKDWQETRPIQSLKSFLIMVLLAVFVDFLVLIDQPTILYVLALLSAGSVLLILTMLYSMIYLMVTHQENSYNQVSQFVFALMVGLGISIFQIAMLDMVRFWLTGTWEGFHFG